MKCISGCNFFSNFKTEYVFLTLIVVLMLFSFLGSSMTIIPQQQSTSYTIEGYSDRIEKEARNKESQGQSAQIQTKKSREDSIQKSLKEGLLYKYTDGIYKGIPKSQIPAGHESMYIRKSQVIPPVCPECPTIEERLDDDEDKCPPCSPCRRCPEPAFICKEIPSDSSNPSANAYLPRPVLTDFSKFGM